MTIKRATPGANIEGIMSSAVYNFGVDQYQRSIGQQSKSFEKPRIQNDTRILIYNTLGDLPRFAIVGYTDPLVLPPILTGDVDPEDGTDGDYDSDCFETYAIGIEEPASGNLTRWGILQEPIPNNTIGECLVSGLTWVKIDAQGQDPTTVVSAIPNGGTTNLVRTACGICRVIYLNPGSGPQWGWVNLG